MARDTKALRPAFEEAEDLLLDVEEEEAKEQEPKESGDTKVVEIPDTQDDQEEVDYLAELTEKQKLRKQLRKLEREIKEEPTIRKTVLVEEELLNIILRLSKKYGYSFQTKFINSAIRHELMRIGYYPPKRT